MHYCCGTHIYLDDLVYFKQSVIDADGKTKEAIRFVCVYNGTESYTMGFFPRKVVKSEKDRLVGEFAQI